jgi:chorismate mutase / prephenate dehydratase
MTMAVVTPHRERRARNRAGSMSSESGNGDDLEQIRHRIDAVDRELLALISRRAALAGEVAKVKSARGEAFCYRPEREAQVLRRIIEQNSGPLSDEETARLFREIMSACLALEQPLAVAYLGPAGTYTQSAALKHFGHSVNTESFASIEEVFREVEAGECQYGVVPVENSIEGVISHTLDSFMQSPLTICGEVELRIRHNLLSRAPSLEKVERVYAHSQALAQCRHWLDHTLPKAERVPVSSNAEAARRATAELGGTAAIAGEAAAELYGLSALAAGIEDDPTNTTRFLVIGHQRAARSGDDKTSVLFSTPNRPGALYHVLGAFAEVGVSMTRIESRPSRRGMWDYLFFVDLEGHAEDASVAEALSRLNDRAAMLKILGSYPRAVL